MTGISNIQGLLNKRLFLILLGTLFALIVADGVVTQYLVVNDLAREANPLLAPWVAQNEFLLVKSLGALASIIILWSIYRRRASIASLAGIIFAVVYTGIVYWNVGVLLVQSITSFNC